MSTPSPVLNSALKEPEKSLNSALKEPEKSLNRALIESLLTGKLGRVALYEAAALGHIRALIEP